MKTTMDLPDDLLIAAKKRAVELRRPLRMLVEDGLRIVLYRRPKAVRRRRPLRWVIVKGGLPPGLDLANRAAMQDWFRKQT